MPTTGRSPDAARRVVRVVILALILDLLSFTMPLPLFPRIIEDFVRKEAQEARPEPTVLSRLLDFVRTLRAYLLPSSSSTRSSSSASRWDLTLLGGLLASLFSFCQFLISPQLGKLGDRFGRRRVLLATMVGNVVSALLWLLAGNFAIYAASRVVGGLSEGNVQLSIAAISDVTTPETRARSLALVGAAFSLAFTFGPSLGAYLSTRTFGKGSLVQLPRTLASTLPSLPPMIQLNSYAVPAAMTVALLSLETLYLYVCLPETRGWRIASIKASLAEQPKSARPPNRPARSLAARQARLRALSRLHLLFLFFFSGAEFTLTFLTHNLFDWSNAQNGRLLGFIGILSALLQGGYVRRKAKGASAEQTARMAMSGMQACAGSLVALALLPPVAKAKGESTLAKVLLWSAAASLAFVSATVVNSLNALASLETDEDEDLTMAKQEEQIDKGHALGSFRSAGQLGRATGPLVMTAIYWTLSPTTAYAACAVGVALVVRGMREIVRDERRRRITFKEE
ncbi:MFS transporter, tetracycline transporter [Rhodotorula toruloides]|uniref:MFS transporter, tetracycline transporter n=1 Tax=Rhodotorula toruloides TaxID=5286 RepID=A0A511KM61_RHOTO|nr:MFS transporter, tetracycline transporter [Rhodotorula toruloides]